VDPLAEKRYSISPYAYCSGNPVNRIDPDGRLDGDPNSGGTRAVDTDEKKTTAQSSTAVSTTNKEESVVIPEGTYVPKTEEKSFLDKYSPFEGGNADPANQGTITDQDKKVGLAWTGLIFGGAVIAELASVTAPLIEYILPTLSVSNSADDALTNKKGESFSQQQTLNPQTKENIGNIKRTISILGAATSFAKPIQTLQSVSKTASTALDVYSAKQFQLWK